MRARRQSQPDPPRRCRDAAGTGFQAGKPRPRDDLHAAFHEGLLDEIGYFGILDRQDPVHRLDQRHLDTHVEIEGGEFGPDRAGPYDEQRFRHRLRHHRLAIGQDAGAVRLNPRKRACPRAGGKNDVTRGQGAAGGRLDLALVTALRAKRSMVVKDRNLVLLQKMLNTCRQPSGNGARAFHDGRKIDADLARHRDAEGFHLVDRMPHFRRAKKRLGGDTSPVQADAAEIFGLDKRHLHLQLRGPDRGDIAAGTAADDNQVKRGLVCHGSRFLREASSPGTRHTP